METDVQAVLLERYIESRAERRAFYQRRTYGMNGMAQSYDPHMLDAANVAKLSSDNVSRMTIARCWVEANCLPTAMDAEIRATYGRMRNSSKDDEVRKVMEMLSNLKLHQRENDSLRASVYENVTDSNAEHELDVENNDDVREASI